LPQKLSGGFVEGVEHFVFGATDEDQAAGGGGKQRTRSGDEYVAFALP
jgi:hypothetical protein